MRFVFMLAFVVHDFHLTRVHLFKLSRKPLIDICLFRGICFTETTRIFINCNCTLIDLC